jgi:hypothetical protein
MCKKYGSRFCGNWIIPNEKLDLVTAELDLFKGEFAEAKRIFVSRYTELCRTWIEQHPEYADIIRQLQIEQKGIEKRFYFDYITYQIGMETLQNLNKALDMVVGSELRHAAADLKTIMVDSIFGADSIGSRVLHRVERICERLDDFRNLDPRFSFVPNFYRAATDGMIRDSRITGRDCVTYFNIVSVMADTEFIYDLIQNELTDPAEILRIHLIKENLLIEKDAPARMEPEERLEKHSNQVTGALTVPAEMPEQSEALSAADKATDEPASVSEPDGTVLKVESVMQPEDCDEGATEQNNSESCDELNDDEPDDETDDYPDDEYSEDDFSASADEAYSVEERYADYGDEPDEACSFSDDELLGGSGWF